MKYLKINAVGNSKRGFTDLTASIVGLLSLLRVFEASACQSSGWSVVGLLSIQKVIMLRPLLQEGRLIRRVSSGLLSLREFSRPPLTGARGLYALKWRLFTSWCGDRQLDPVNCPICTALEFVQTCFSAGFTHSTLKVYVAALPAHRTLLGGHSVVRHPQVTRFLHSARKLYALKWGSLHGAEVTSLTQSTARLVEFWSSCWPVPPWGLLTPPWRSTWWLYRPTAPLSVAFQSVDTPSYTVLAARFNSQLWSSCRLNSLWGWPTPPWRCTWRR